ncbi:DUF6361 family protein [Brevibacterium sp. ZH18]|uniref:DUF6361 family protein n=1 Tax=Brevibacterium sp. ZH18 TaxID=2927784 RepID=UPI001F622F99|nr:DUF6361 family protein [Brevibacterium sp. ZH18]
MVAAITWLDASSETQRQMRDVIRLFEQKESRDELGLSQFRDGLSDGLFPGTSVLLTRARYMLFIPWAFIKANASANPLAQERKHEFATINALKAAGERDGLIGRQAGNALKTLPSTMYWSALNYYGILTMQDMTREQAAAAAQRGKTLKRSSRPSNTGPWHPGLPAVPGTFPNQIDDGFALSEPEAEWLRDRMAQSSPSSLLNELLYRPPESDSEQLWTDSAARSCTGEAKELVERAEVFSKMIHGAQLLYNLLLARKAENAFPERHEGRTEQFEEELHKWAVSVVADRVLDRWDFSALVESVTEIRRRPVDPRAKIFIHAWGELVTSKDPSTIAANADAVRLVSERERTMKRRQARLDNPRLLARWNGASGAGQLSFRWTQVRRVILDIHDGLQKAPVDNA